MDKKFKIAIGKELLDDLKKPNFGSLIIASRLKFHWLEEKSIFIRIGEVFPNRFRIEICNWIVLIEQEIHLEKIMRGHMYYDPRIKENLDYILKQINPLNNSVSKIPNELISFLVDMDGFEIYE